MGNKIYVGIDLGTTNTLVAYEKNGKPATLPFIGSGNVLPSVLYLDAETQAIEIGLDAYRNGNYAPENRIKSSKTFMGREMVYNLPVKHGNPITMTPTDVAAEILKTVKKRIIMASLFIILKRSSKEIKKSIASQRVNTTTMRKPHQGSSTA